MPPAESSIAIDPARSSGAVFGQPRFWLRLEAVAVLCLAITLYARGRHSWLLFALLFLAPDITFLGYLAGPRVGSVCYNFAHSYVVPVAFGVILHVLGRSIAVPLIWIAHIGFDRSIGYGLKYRTGFRYTHLGTLGPKVRQYGSESAPT